MKNVALLVTSIGMLAACGNAGVEVPSSLAGTMWQVEDIDEGGIIDRSHVTLEFESDERVAGTTGCNRYFGTLQIDGSLFAVSGAGNPLHRAPGTRATAWSSGTRVTMLH